MATVTRLVSYHHLPLAGYNYRTAPSRPCRGCRGSLARVRVRQCNGTYISKTTCLPWMHSVSASSTAYRTLPFVSESGTHINGDLSPIRVLNGWIIALNPLIVDELGWNWGEGDPGQQTAHVDLRPC
jgi:hypothetical protein